MGKNNVDLLLNSNTFKYDFNMYRMLMIMPQIYFQGKQMKTFSSPLPVTVSTNSLLQNINKNVNIQHKINSSNNINQLSIKMFWDEIRWHLKLSYYLATCKDWFTIWNTTTTILILILIITIITLCNQSKP